MKMKAMLKNEKGRQTMRNALIRRIDAALDAQEPDMDTVDVCRALLDALEHGSCQPGGKRMRQELSRIAEEIDYIPRANAMVTVKPMTVRGVLVGVLAVCMCLFLLPVTVMLLRGGIQGIAGQELAETPPVTEDALCSADTDHVKDTKEMIAQKEELIAKLEENITETIEMKQSFVETLDSIAADRDKTNKNEEIAFIEEKISDMENKLQALQEELRSAIAEREFILSQNAS